MKYQKLLFLLFISYTFEIRRNLFIRRLQADSDLPNTEPETEELETTVPYVPPEHEEETTVPIVNPEPSGRETTPGEIPTPSHNQTETETPGTPTTDPHSFPGIIEPVTSIPSVISSPTYDIANTKSPKLLWAGLGNFNVPPPRAPTPNSPLNPRRAVFEAYFIRIDGDSTIMPVRIYIVVTITYRRLRALQQATEDKDETAVCDRTSFDEDPNVRYNCSFQVEEEGDIGNVAMDPSTPPVFEGLTGAAAPQITISSLVNETMTEKGIQTATSNDLLKTQYLLNNTVLEENGLRFKLKGEMSSYTTEKKIILSFDEKGNGKIKNATCDVNYLQAKVYELDCLAERGINSHLNGVTGITTGSEEKVIIYMKEGTDEILNVGSNYMGLYNRSSSSGLSGGAIAGIVIACVIVLLAIAIGVMFCRKSSVPAPFQESTLGVNVNTSNMTD